MGNIKSAEEIYYDLKEKNSRTGASLDTIAIAAMEEHTKQYLSQSLPISNVIDKINTALQYWETFDGEKQKGIAYGLGLALEHIKKENSLPVDSNVYKWVKASDELPDNEYQVPLRLTDIIPFLEEEILEYTIGFYDMEDNKWYSNDDKEITLPVFWLKEVKPTSQPEISNVDEAAEKLYPESSKAIYEIPKRQMANIERQAFKEGAEWYASQLNRTDEKK